MVKIIADSTCDLSGELIEKYGISILPLHILLGDKEYEDGIEITPDEIYRWSDENKTTPKTSAPALERAVELFRPYIEAGRDIVCFAISEDMSTSANVMRLAAAELEAEEHIFVVDSMNLSTGIGLLVIEAAEAAAAGKSAEEIVTHIEKLRPLVRASFVVDTLTYLHRGGRCSGVAAMAGGILKLHPKIEVVDGKMAVGRKYRGSMEHVMMSYAEDLKESMENAFPNRVFITHSGCGEEVIKRVKDYLEGLHMFDEIWVTRAGGVISSHCGPGTLGVLFMER